MKQIIPIDPRSEEARDAIACTDPREIPKLVERARREQKAWEKLAYSEKREIFKKISESLAESEDELSGLISAEMGKLERTARGEVKTYVKKILRDIDLMEEARQSEDLPFDGGVTRLNWIAHGVAAVITPWNFPVGMPVSLLTPTLLAGNTVLFKPSEITTQTGLKIAEIFNRHLPAGILQTVVGAEEQGRAMVQAPTDFIAFVGSREVGKKILTASSDRVCRVLLEMGGKDPMIVAADADLEKAADFAVQGSLYNSGQVCCSVERIYVERGAEETFVKKILERMNQVHVGEKKPGLVSYGPMSSEAQMEIVLNHIEDAREKGATICHGGARLKRKGYYLEPTVISSVTDDMKVINEETFGPVICIQGVNSVDEGIAKANDTRYGLTASLWMGDEELAREKSLDLEAGVVGVNRPFHGSSLTPWAGAKESGLGHTNGFTGMRQFLQPRSVAVNLTETNAGV